MKREKGVARPSIRHRWEWCFPGRTRYLLTCTNHAMVRYMQRVLGIDVDDDYIVPACQQPPLFWMIRRALAFSRRLSDKQVAIFDSKQKRVAEQGYFMTEDGVVVILRRAEISTIYKLGALKSWLINWLSTAERSPFSLDPTPHYLHPFPIELLLVPNPITEAWGNGIQEWLRTNEKPKQLLYESGLRFEHLQAFFEDTPVELVELPALSPANNPHEAIQAWLEALRSVDGSRFAILHDQKLLLHLLHHLASPNVHLAPWKEHFVPGLVYGIDPKAAEQDQVQCFPLCV